jgi:hypothetical protein
MKSQMLRWMWTVGAATALLGSAKGAQALDECQVDTDCMQDMVCGGFVCSWTVDPSGHKCVAATTKDKGWCNGADTDCKCMGEGAKCQAPYCTFTQSKVVGTGGAGGAGGSGTTGTGGSGTGGTGTTSGSGGTAANPAPASSSSSCSISSVPARGLGSVGALVGVAALAFATRRRRHAA